MNCQSHKRRSRSLWSFVFSLYAFILVWLGWPSFAAAGPLTDRIAAFPHWETKPPVQPYAGDLVYPDWFAGKWLLTSTLVDVVAPLAPEVTTPGFESNQRLLNEPVTCQVRFVVNNTLARNKAVLPLLSLPTQSLVKAQIVSDRAFNGLSLAKAYLGDRVSRVWVDSRQPDRLITKFLDNRKLFSMVTGQATEQPDADHFIASEVFQQFFQAPQKPFKNQVETTTAYTHTAQGDILADQITAVYLTPPHPKAYLAGNRPVTLYRYQLQFKKV